MTALVRLGVFVALLALVFGAAYGVGSLSTPIDRPPMDQDQPVDHAQHG